MIEIVQGIAVEEEELQESFIRASGPGGQNVNKVSSAVQLRFDLKNSPSLPGDLKQRARRLAGRRLTKDGVIIITANRYRTQEQNRADARERLIELLQKAAVRPVRRRPTKPSRSAKRRRTDAKTRRGATKKLRGSPKNFD